MVIGGHGQDCPATLSEPISSTAATVSAVRTAPQAGHGRVTARSSGTVCATPSAPAQPPPTP
ncbi:hypothetical protein [Streptomyces avidinii]